MSDPKKIRCSCGEEIALCTRCGFQPVEHMTTDDQHLCMDCAQDTHLPCEECGSVVPCAEVTEDGTCIDCRLKMARQLWVHGKTEKIRKRGEALLNSIGAEVVLVWLITSKGTENVGPVKVEDALYGVRRMNLKQERKHY